MTNSLAVKQSLTPCLPIQSNEKNTYDTLTKKISLSVVSNPVNTPVNLSLISAVSNALSKNDVNINVYGTTTDLIISSKDKNMYDMLTKEVNVVSNYVNTPINLSPISAVNNVLSQNDTKINVYGAATDLKNARSILGTTGYNYIRTDMGSEIPKFTCGDIVLGGVNTRGGIGDVNLHGASRLWGMTEDDTKKEIQNYLANVSTSNNKTKNVYGASIDIQNAKEILGYTGYNYIITDNLGDRLPTFNCNDIILGGVNTRGGIKDINLHGAHRLWGNNVYETKKEIQNYADFIASRNPPVQNTVKNVYGASIDIQNAKRILGTTCYKYILTDQEGFRVPKFTSNDIILGGVNTKGGIGNVNLNGATRLWGNTFEDTVLKIKNYAGPKTVYGALADLNNAKSILGNVGYKYKRTDQAGFKMPTFTSQDIILGGEGTGGGIGNVNLNGAIRLWGNNADLTAQAINNYNSPKYVYGAKTDIDNAISILGTSGYNYIRTDQAGFEMPAFTSNDIVLGGIKTRGGIGDVNLNGATRLDGVDAAATKKKIKNYSLSKIVYGAKTDIDNAKRILGDERYNYIRTDISGFKMPTFTSNAIILGGEGTGGGIGHVNLNGAIRLWGNNADLTEMRIREYAHTPDISNGNWGMINRAPASMCVDIVNDTTGAKVNIPEGTKLQIYSSSGDYYDCYYPGTNGVKVLKAYLTPTTAPVTPPGPSSKIIDNFRNDTSLGLSQSQKDSMITVLSTLLNKGYEPAFVAGVLGNIQAEGTAGYFESSAYISNPSAEPAYLKYMDEHYNYRQEFSGKSISEVGIAKTYNLLQKIKTDGVANKATFGLGCVQWTWDRTVSLIDCYIAVCGPNSYPTTKQCRQAENTMIINELDGDYHYVYTNWLSQSKGTVNAAYNAGSIVCKQYEVPANTNNQAIIRGNNATKIYNVMMGL